MTETDNEKLLRDFFLKNKQEIADKGFSRRVRHHLPNQNNWLTHIWTTFVLTVGVVLFVWLDGLQAIWETLREVFVNMVNYGTTHLDPKSLLIAAIVLLYMAARKISSMA